MSDNPTTTTQTPDAGAGQSGGVTPNTQGQPAAATPPAAASGAATTQEAYRAFASENDLNQFVQGRVKTAERSAIKKLAKDLGFEDADEMREALAALRRAQGGEQPTTPDAEQPTNATAQPDTGTRLQMALKVGAELNLPAALIGRLQGESEEAMKADAQSLLTLMGGTASSRGPGIPPVPPNGQPVTFTQTQLKDAEFVRNNAAAIQAAAREGRIARS